MNTKIELQGQPGVMACTAKSIPGFPGAQFTLAYPEAIGDMAGPYWFGTIKPSWESRADGSWISRGEQAGQLSYEITMTASADSVTSHFKLTNHSETTWKQGMAFNCFQCAGDNSIRDH